jgi:N-acetylglutamate synthase-like GNAT family acetyltransferase
MDRSALPPVETFSEKGFYLGEFRGRTLGIAACAEDLQDGSALEKVLAELEANATRVVLVSTSARTLEALVGAPAVPPDEDRLPGAVWRGFARSARVGVLAGGRRDFEAACRGIALRLGLTKLVWIDPGGGLRDADGRRASFVDLEELGERLRGGAGGIGERDPAEAVRRTRLLLEVEAALREGLPAVNLCSLEGLADELFSYAGSGTLFTRERYVVVRRLGLDDYDAANDLVARGVAEGYLAPRPADEVERLLARGFGAFVEGHHLAGIGALIDHPASHTAEIASLYTLTRFLGEGIGGHLIRFAVEQARGSRHRYVFACTTSERVASFFETHGFRAVEGDAIPAEKWRSYDPARRQRLRCLRHDLG